MKKSEKLVISKKIEKELVKKDKNKKDKSSFKEVESDEAPKSSYGKGLDSPYLIPGFDLHETLDAIEKKVGSSSTSMGANEKRMSTGVLAYDLILGGGITAGWYTNFGKEQSCKSTGAMTFLSSALTQGIPIISYHDYEGSTSGEYVQNILNTMGVDAKVEDVFGIRDRKGNYIKAPRVRYVSASTAESFFDYLASLERSLPDKIYEGDGWWYVYENTKPNRKKLADGGHEYDKKLFSTHNKFYVPAEDGRLQAILIVDSYPSMLPERLDEEDSNSGLGAVARMFAEQLPRVKGKMRKKRIAVVGVNQVRDRPMVRFGNPEYEPCGQAIRFYSDARIKHMARAVSAVKDATQAEGGQEHEASVEFPDSKDIYRYISIKAEKNKLSTPYLSGFIRLWITDGAGNARGFDPVFDTYEYLKATGQVSFGVMKRTKIVIKLHGQPPASKPIDWMDFKRLILGTKEEIKTICKKAGLSKPVRLRPFCFKQLQKGDGLDLYLENKKSGVAETASED